MRPGRRSPLLELAAYSPCERRKFAKNHSFSAGLLIGGKDVEYEKEKVTSAPAAATQTLPKQA